MTYINIGKCFITTKLNGVSQLCDKLELFLAINWISNWQFRNRFHGVLLTI